MRPSLIPREVGTCAARDVAGGSGHAGCTGAGSGGCSPATWRRASSGPRRRAPGGARRRNARATGTALAVSFGDAFLLDSFLRSSGLMACADACGHAEPDTVRALLAFYVLTGLANRHAVDWWELTYARLPCPRARMASQRAGECLADLGSEDAKRRFVGEYLALVGRRREAEYCALSVAPVSRCPYHLSV